MNKIVLSIAALSLSFIGFSQLPQFPNGGFEEWTGSGNSLRPVDFHTNKDGSSTAQLGPLTATKVTSGQRSGNACVMIESKGYLGNTIIVNGNLTTGFINAPSTQKVEGYIGTQNYDDLSDSRKYPFTARPDSLVGYFKYQPANHAEEKAKINAVLHVGEFNDPEEPVNGNHADLSANKIGNAMFISEHQSYNEWTRFSVPFNYVSDDAPEYLLINITSSNNQLTTTVGSKFWLDDLKFVYNSELSAAELQATDIAVYVKDNRYLMVDLTDLSLSNARLSVVDFSGKEIMNFALHANTMNELKLPNVNSGVYVYRIIGDNFVNNGKINL